MSKIRFKLIKFELDVDCGLKVVIFGSILFFITFLDKRVVSKLVQSN